MSNIHKRPSRFSYGCIHKEERVSEGLPSNEVELWPVSRTEVTATHTITANSKGEQGPSGERERETNAPVGTLYEPTFHKCIRK